MKNTLDRKYGLFTAICMVVGIVIGSGVFFKAQDILTKTGGDMSMGILAWLIGGAIMLVCLLTFSIMGQKYEKVNGVVDYAEATVGPRYGYMMGWFIATIYFPAMTSILAWLSARYTMMFLISVKPDLPMVIPGEGGCVAGPECMALALCYLCLVYGMNALSPKLAGKFQTSTTVIKLIPLGLMAILGTLYGLINGTLFENLSATAAVTEIAPDASALTKLTANPLFAAVCSTAFAYEGWIIATSINSEIKNSKRNLPLALTVGGIAIVAVYLFYYIGVAGAAKDLTLLMEKGTTVVFTDIFGTYLGNILMLFVAISCLGTANGLMLGCTRCMYSLAARRKGPAPEVFGQVDPKTNMPTNSSVFALMATGLWFLFFYLSQLSGTKETGSILAATCGKLFAFDSSELPIITVYLMYFPILIMWMRKAKDQNVLRRFVMPILALLGSTFMVIACIVSHKLGCIGYLILFAVIMVIGLIFYKKNK